jgi:hypothetical protein
MADSRQPIAVTIPIKGTTRHSFQHSCLPGIRFTPDSLPVFHPNDIGTSQVRNRSAVPGSGSGTIEISVIGGQLVDRTALSGALLTVLCTFAPAAAEGVHLSHDLERINRCLCGKVIDYTRNHGADRRIWSPSLCQRRDLYVYVPPGFDPCRQYPVMLWLHGFTEDEHTFLVHVAPELDRVIASGKLPPLIVAAPDGSLTGRGSYFSAGSFFVNSKAGKFEDFVIRDVWTFVNENYPIRPEREAHVLGGVSMGGFSAYNLGIKYQDMFKTIIGIFPPVNLRWVDCHCNYMGNFSPCCWGWRTQLDRGSEVLGRFYGVITVRVRRVIDPLFGRGPAAVAAIARENPIEMLDTFGLQNGVLDMYIAYGGKDEFNIDAQVESFLFRAKERGLCIEVGYDPQGRHDIATAKRLFPGVIDWLAPRLAPFALPCPE